MYSSIQWGWRYDLSHRVLVKVKWFSVYIKLLEQCQARVNTMKEVEILLLPLNGVPVAIVVVWMWKQSWAGAMRSRWQEGNNKQETLEAKRDDGRQSVRPCDDDRVKSLSHVQLFVTPWAVAYQASPSVGFSRQEHWSGLPFPPAGDLPHPGIKPASPTLQADPIPSEPPGKPEVTRAMAYDKAGPYASGLVYWVSLGTEDISPSPQDFEPHGQPNVLCLLLLKITSHTCVPQQPLDSA